MKNIWKRERRRGEREGGRESEAFTRSPSQRRFAFVLWRRLCRRYVLISINTRPFLSFSLSHSYLQTHPHSLTHTLTRPHIQTSLSFSHFQFQISAGMLQMFFDNITESSEELKKVSFLFCWDYFLSISLLLFLSFLLSFSFSPSLSLLLFLSLCISLHFIVFERMLTFSFRRWKRAMRKPRNWCFWLVTHTVSSLSLTRSYTPILFKFSLLSLFRKHSHTHLPPKVQGHSLGVAALLAATHMSSYGLSSSLLERAFRVSKVRKERERENERGREEGMGEEIRQRMEEREGEREKRMREVEGVRRKGIWSHVWLFMKICFISEFVNSLTTPKRKGPRVIRQVRFCICIFALSNTLSLSLSLSPFHFLFLSPTLSPSPSLTLLRRGHVCNILV